MRPSLVICSLAITVLNLTLAAPLPPFALVKRTSFGDDVILALSAVAGYLPGMAGETTEEEVLQGAKNYLTIAGWILLGIFAIPVGLVLVAGLLYGLFVCIVVVIMSFACLIKKCIGTRKDSTEVATDGVTEETDQETLTEEATNSEKEVIDLGEAAIDLEKETTDLEKEACSSIVEIAV